MMAEVNSGEIKRKEKGMVNIFFLGGSRIIFSIVNYVETDFNYNRMINSRGYLC